MAGGLAGGASGLGLYASALASDIGVVAAARADLTGTAPGQGPRALALGAGVVQDDRIISSADGGGQLLFQDQSSLSIAPGSDVVLDRYVYDPDREAGEIGLTLAKGALRFIGGRITKERDAVVTTPTATLAIRGGIALVDLRGGVLRVTHIAGERTEIRLPDGQFLSLSREGGTAEVRPVAGGGFEVIYLGVATPAEIEATYAAVGGEGAPQAVVLEDADPTAIAFDEPGGVFRQPVSTDGAEPQPSQEVLPEIIIEQVEIDVGEIEVDVVLNETPTPPAGDDPADDPFGPGGPLFGCIYLGDSLACPGTTF